MRFALVAFALLLSSCFALAASDLKELKVLDKTEIKSVEFVDVQGAVLNGKAYSFEKAFVKITFTANAVDGDGAFGEGTADYVQKAFLRGVKLKGTGTPPAASSIANGFKLEFSEALKPEAFVVENEGRLVQYMASPNKPYSLKGSGVVFVDKDTAGTAPKAEFKERKNVYRGKYIDKLVIDLGGLAPAYYAAAKSGDNYNSFSTWVLTDKIEVSLDDVERYDFEGGLAPTRLARHVVRTASEGEVPRLQSDNVGGGYALYGIPIFKDAAFYTLPEAAATDDGTGRLEITLPPGESGAKLYCTNYPLLDETQLLAEYALGALTGKDACVNAKNADCFQKFMKKLRGDYTADEETAIFNYSRFIETVRDHAGETEYSGIAAHLNGENPSAANALNFVEMPLSGGSAFAGGLHACYLRLPVDGPQTQTEKTYMVYGGNEANLPLYADEIEKYYQINNSAPTAGAKLDAVDLNERVFVNAQLAAVNYGVETDDVITLGGSALSIALISDDGYSIEASGMQPVKYAYSQLAEPVKGVLLALQGYDCPASGGQCSCRLVGAPAAEKKSLAEEPGDDYYISQERLTPEQARINCDNLKAAGSGTYQDDNGLTLTTADQAAINRYSQTASVKAMQTASLASSTRVSANSPSGVNCPVSGECGSVVDSVTLEKFELLNKCPQVDELKIARTSARTDVCARFKGYVDFSYADASLVGVTASSSFGINPGGLSISQTFAAQVKAPAAGSATGNIEIVFALPSYFKTVEDAKANFELGIKAKLAGDKVCPTKGVFQITYKTTAREEYLVYTPKFYDGKLHG